MSDTNTNGSPKMMQNIFGIIMIIVYVGMGVLFFCNFFQFSGKWQWLRWAGGVMFVLYGFWRAYRQFKINPEE